MKVCNLRLQSESGHYSKGVATAAFALLLAVSTAGIAQDGEWTPVTGAQKLRDFMSGLTAERELPSGGLARGEYRADGTGTLNAWGETFPRAWSVKGDDQICVSEPPTTVTICYALERNNTDLSLYRVRDVATGAVAEIRVTDGRALVKAEPSEMGNKGGAVAVSAQEMADKLANPTAALGSMGNNLSYTAFDGDLPGASDESGWTYLFQPVLPFPQKNGANILFRPGIPLVLDTPVPRTGGGFDSAGVELGDIPFDLVYGRKFENGALFSAGVAGLIPSATDDRLGADQWRLGPEVLFGVSKKWGAMGAIVNHQWNIAGSNDTSTSVTAGQYFYALNLGNAWQLAAGPSFSYDHNAPSGDKLTFPLGIGLAKTAILGGRPWKFQIQYWNYVEAPDTFGPKHLVRLTVTQVVELPWSK